MLAIGAPQIIWIVLLALGLGISIQQHGQPKTGHHNFGVSLLGAALSAGILYWGGFFTA